MYQSLSVQELCSLWNICCIRVAWSCLLGVDSSRQKQVSRSSYQSKPVPENLLCWLLLPLTEFHQAFPDGFEVEWIYRAFIPFLKYENPPKRIAPKWVGSKSGRDRWDVNCQPVGDRLKSLAGQGGSSELRRNGKVGGEETGTWDQDKTCWVGIRNMGHAN